MIAENETMSALMNRAADRLTVIDQEATRGPWLVVCVGSSDAPGQLDGDGGDLFGETMSSPNRDFVIAMREVAGPLAEILRDEARDWEDSEELVLPGHPMARMCRAILGEGDAR